MLICLKKINYINIKKSVFDYPLTNSSKKFKINLVVKNGTIEPKYSIRIDKIINVERENNCQFQLLMYFIGEYMETTKNTNKEQREDNVKKALAISISEANIPSKQAMKKVRGYIEGKDDLKEIQDKIIREYDENER